MLKSLSVSNKYFFWAVLGLFVLIPLYPKIPLFNVPGTYVAIRLEDFLIAGAILWWIVSVKSKLKELLSDSLTKSILLFWAIGLMSLFSGIFITQTVTPHLGILHFLRRVESMILLLVAISAFSNINQVKIWLKVMTVTALAVVLYGFGQQWLKFPVISTTNKEFSKGLILFLSPEARVNSTFAGHYDLAVFLSVFLIIATSIWIFIRSLKQKVWLAVIEGLSFILLALTAARVSFVAAFLGLVSLFLFLGQKKLILILIGLSLVAFIVSPDLRHRTVATLTVNLLGGGGEKYTPPPQDPNSKKHFSIEKATSGSATPSGVPVDIAPGEPINTTELGVHRSYGIRLDVEWPRAIRSFTKNPLLGTGYSSITIATDNDYLRSLGETGILGTLSLSLIFIIIIKKLWRSIKETKDLKFYLNIGLLCSLLAVFLTSLFIDVLESSKVAQLLWLSLGVGLASANMEGEQSA